MFINNVTSQKLIFSLLYRHKVKKITAIFIYAKLQLKVIEKILISNY